MYKKKVKGSRTKGDQYKERAHEKMGNENKKKEE